MQCLKPLIEKHYKTLTRFGCALTLSERNARDLIAEAFIDIVSREKEVPCTDEDFLRWFYKYMKLLTLSKYGNYYKATHAKEKPTTLLIEIPDVEDGRERPPLHSYKEFKKSLDSLDAVLFNLIYEQKLTLKQICDRYKNGMTVQRLHLLSRPLRLKVKQFTKNL